VKTIPLEIRAGETLALDLTELRDEEGAAVESLSGWSALLQVRATAAATAALLSLTSTIVDQALHLQGSTAALAPGHYVYDVRVQSPTGFVSYLQGGSFIVHQPVSRL
jgi:hypothetical protein